MTYDKNADQLKQNIIDEYAYKMKQMRSGT